MKNIEIQNQKRFEMSKINAIYTYTIETLRILFELILIILLVILVEKEILTSSTLPAKAVVMMLESAIVAKRRITFKN